MSDEAVERSRREIGQMVRRMLMAQKVAFSPIEWVDARKGAEWVLTVPTEKGTLKVKFRRDELLDMNGQPATWKLIETRLELGWKEALARGKVPMRRSSKISRWPD